MCLERKNVHPSNGIVLENGLLDKHFKRSKYILKLCNCVTSVFFMCQMTD